MIGGTARGYYSSGGSPIEAIPIDDLFPIPAKLYRAYPRSFMLRVRGNSVNRRLPDGHYALIDPCSSADFPNDLYAVAIGREKATIKLIRKLSNGIDLIPDSDDPTNHSIVFDYADKCAEEVQIIGRVVWSCPPPSTER